MSFVCPLCPGGASFDDEHSLKVHISSALHINSQPYECRVCHGRYATRQECHHHHQTSHRNQPFVPIVHDEEEGPKRLQVHLIMKYAREVAQGQAPALDDLTAMGSVAGGFPMELYVPLAQQAAFEALEGGLIDASVQSEKKTAPAKRDGTCAKCPEEVADSYSARRQHIFEAHSAGLEGVGVKAKQVKLKEVMGECFPAARVLNDLTCHGCGEELQITGRTKDFTKLQLAHIETNHMQEDLGVRLTCSVAGCADRHVAKPTGLALFQHIKQVHGNIGTLDHVSKAGYTARRLEAKQQVAQNKTRYFPHPRRANENQ